MSQRARTVAVTIAVSLMLVLQLGGCGDATESAVDTAEVAAAPKPRTDAGPRADEPARPVVDHTAFVGEWEGRMYFSKEYIDRIHASAPEGDRGELEAQYRASSDKELYRMLLESGGSGVLINYAFSSEPTACTWRMSFDGRLMTVSYMLPRLSPSETEADLTVSLELDVAVDGSILRDLDPDLGQGDSGLQFTRPGVYVELEKPELPGAFRYAESGQRADYLGSWTGSYVDDDLYSRLRAFVSKADAQAMLEDLDQVDVFHLDLRDDSTCKVAQGDDATRGIWTIAGNGATLELRFGMGGRAPDESLAPNLTFKLNTDKNLLLMPDTHEGVMPQFVYVRD